MFGVTTSDDYRPVAWMGRFPVDVTTILVGIHVVLAIVACLLVAAAGGGLLDLMMFDSARVLGSGQSGVSRLMPSFIRPCSCFGSRSKCTCFLSSAAK